MNDEKSQTPREVFLLVIVLMLLLIIVFAIGGIVENLLTGSVGDVGT